MVDTFADTHTHKKAISVNSFGIVIIFELFTLSTRYQDRNRFNRMKKKKQVWLSKQDKYTLLKRKKKRKEKKKTFEKRTFSFLFHQTEKSDQSELVLIQFRCFECAQFEIPFQLNTLSIVYLSVSCRQ